MASWRIRYFVLQAGTDPSLMYFREPRRGGGPPAGVLLLAGGTVSAAPPSQPTAFIVEASGCVYHLRASSSGQRQHWVDCIAAAIHRAAAAATPSPAAGGSQLRPSPTRSMLTDSGPSVVHARRGSSSSAGADTPLPSPASGAGTPGSATPHGGRHPRGRSRTAASSSETVADATRPGAGNAAGMAAAGTAAVDAYSASLPSLQGRSGRQTMQALMAGGGAGLALESIAEHYQRAMLFMDRHHAELSDEHLAVLAVGSQAQAGSAPVGDNSSGLAIVAASSCGSHKRIIVIACAGLASDCSGRRCPDRGRGGGAVHACDGAQQGAARVEWLAGM